MSDMKEPVNRDALILEGMYKGIVGKIEESQGALSRELQFSATQQVSSYEALSHDVERRMERVVTELKFLAEQNSSIFECNERARSESRDKILSSADERSKAIEQKLADTKQEILDAVRTVLAEQAEENKKQLESAKQELLEAVRAAALTVPQPDYDLIAERVKVAMTPVEEDAFDYEVLAEKISTILPETDYDTAAEKIAAIIPEVDYDVVTEKLATAVPQIDYDILSDKIAAAVPQPDYDLIAEKVKETLYAEDEVEIEVDEAAELQAEQEAQAEQDAFVDLIAQKVADAIDMDTLANKVASAMPEADYDHSATLIAAAIVSKMPANANDENSDSFADAISGNIVNAIADQFDVTVEEEGIARIADAVAGAIDYDLLAEKVAELLKAEEGDLVRIAETVIPVEEPVEEVAEEPVEAEEKVEEVVEEIAEEPAVEEPVEEEAELALAVSDDEEEDEREGVDGTLNDPSMITRYKRSFIAKITQSDETVKDYYSDVKNVFLSYDKVRSQVSWSGDRFTKGRETLAKIGVRGKTLCLYLALNPDEFPLTVYHQKFAGDTKAYEKTPMMVKIKSNVGLKRAIRLIETVMEREEATLKQDVKPVDYTKMYQYKSDKKLLEEGLIKTAVVEKTDLNF